MKGSFVLPLLFLTFCSVECVYLSIYFTHRLRVLTRDETKVLSFVSFQSIKCWVYPFYSEEDVKIVNLGTRFNCKVWV